MSNLLNRIWYIIIFFLEYFVNKATSYNFSLPENQKRLSRVEKMLCTYVHSNRKSPKFEHKG